MCPFQSSNQGFHTVILAVGENQTFYPVIVRKAVGAAGGVEDPIPDINHVQQASDSFSVSSICMAHLLFFIIYLLRHDFH